MAIGVQRGRRAGPFQRLGQAMVARGGNSLAEAASQAPGVSPKPKSPSSKFHPFQVLKGLETGSVLSGKQLSAAARALAALETRPEIRGYRQIANQLNREKEREAKGLTALGEKTQANVSSVYKNIAESEARNLAAQQALSSSLSGQSAAIAKQGAQQTAQMQEGALGDYQRQLQMRGAQNEQGGAQRALANAVANQQATQNADSQAAQQLANQSGADFLNYRSALGGATQMQGAGAVGALGRDIVNRIGESNAKYDTNIQTARGKLGEARANIGGRMVKNLLGLREGEQKFLLGEQATRTNKEKLAAEKEQNREANAIARQNAASSATSAHASLINALTSRWESHHPGASSNELLKHRREVKHDVNEVKALIPGVVAELGRPPKNPKELRFLEAKMNSKAGADPVIVQRVLHGHFSTLFADKPGSGGLGKHH